MSGVIVPTMDAFNALEARVTALENATPEPVPPDPPDPEPIPPGEGVQAKRICQLIELFGVNTFSSLDTGNVWGSWPADYRPDSVIAALNWITESSGFALRLREYHYAGREVMQLPWFEQITNAIPAIESTICVGANGSEDDVASMLSLAEDPACGIRWVEGLNEPNTDFGQGFVPVETTQAIQDALWRAGDRSGILGPSIVAGTPHPEGWITGYCGASMDAINAAMACGNGHYYPPHCPDVPNTGYSINEYVGGLWTAYAQHPIHLTEFHPTLYAAGTFAVKENIARLAGRLRDHLPIPGFRANAQRDDYYTLLTLFRCAKNGTMGLWWYALFDYGTTYECGLFPKEGGVSPRSSAVALRNLCRVCADPDDTMRTFAPGKLDFTVSGASETCDWDLYQASDGRFLLLLWNAREDQGGAAVTMTLNFASPVAQIDEFNPCVSSDALRHGEGTQHIVQLDASARVLAIYP